MAPGEGAFALSLASAAIGFDTPRAVALFTALLETVDSREGWLGLAAARLASGEAEAARAALDRALGRHAPHPDLAALAEHVVHATAAAGWCGLDGTGRLLVRASGSGPVEAWLDGARVPVDDLRADDLRADDLRAGRSADG